MDEHRPAGTRPYPLPRHDDGEAFSQAVDGRRGTVEALRRSGHDRILLDLSGLPAVGESRDRDLRSAWRGGRSAGAPPRGRTV